MHLVYQEDHALVFLGDALEVIDQIPDDLIQSCITSPTYWGKRQFTSDRREFGKESLEEYVNRNVFLYDKILHKMKKGGSLFIIIQDSYMGSGVSRSHHNHWSKNKNPEYLREGLDSVGQGNVSSVTASHKTIKNKSLCGIPYRIALALVDRGYIWREQIIWEKPNPMPENVKDRVRQSSEYILHFVKSRKYIFNSQHMMVEGNSGKPRMRNQVWVAPTEPKKGHTATFPTKIIENLLLATSKEGDVIFEPFLGSGTMYELSKVNKRNFVGCDISYDLIQDFIDRNNTSTAKKQDLSKVQIPTIEALVQLDQYQLKDITLLSNNKEKSDSIKDDFRNFSFDIIDRLLDDLIIGFGSTFEIKDRQTEKSMKLGEKTYQFIGYLEIDETKIALSIPSITNFDVNKGAGAFYASVRFKEAIGSNLIDLGVLLVPKTAINGKFKEIITSIQEKLLVLNISQETAENYLDSSIPNTDNPIQEQISRWLAKKLHIFTD